MWLLNIYIHKYQLQSLGEMWMTKSYILCIKQYTWVVVPVTFSLVQYPNDVLSAWPVMYMEPNDGSFPADNYVNTVISIKPRLMMGTLHLWNIKWSLWWNAFHHIYATRCYFTITGIPVIMVTQCCKYIPVKENLFKVLKPRHATLKLLILEVTYPCQLYLMVQTWKFSE